MRSTSSNAMTHVSLATLSCISAGVATFACAKAHANSSARYDVIRRHNPLLVDAQNTGEVVALGNGFFAAHVGCTGSQAGNETYAKYFGVNTMAEWAFHAMPYYGDEENPLLAANPWEVRHPSANANPSHRTNTVM